MIRGIVMLFVLMLANAWGGECRKTGSSCIDTTPCKTINGRNVCLANIGESCWKYNDTYECKESIGPDYCAAIESAPGCSQYGSAPCTEGYAWDGTCLGYTKTFTCSDSYPGGGVVLLDTSYTIVSDNKDYAACTSWQNNPSCSPTGGEVCIQYGNLTPDGPWDCLQWQKTYTCRVSSYSDYCSPLVSAGCALDSQSCAPGGTAYDGSCIEFRNRYRCDNRQGEPLPPYVAFLDTAYDIIYDNREAPECADEEANSQCKIASEVCLEPAGTRIINGLPVYKDCWKWQRNYTCVVAQMQNSCRILEENSTCVAQPNPECRYTAWNGTCLKYRKIFNCDASQEEPLPTDVIHLDDNFTIVYDQTDPSQCLNYQDNPNCQLNSSVCVEGPETRIINGLPVHKDCWRWNNTYTCASGSPTSTCGQLASDPNCVLQSSHCVDNLDDGSCSTTEKVYSCRVADGRTEVITSCSAPPDGDFVTATAMMEIGRQAGTYMTEDTKIFSGEPNKCREKLIANCCKVKSSGGSRNSDLFGASASYPSITGAVLSNSVKFMGSTYVHDALFATNLIPTSSLNWLYGGTTGGAGSSYAFSYYGVTISYTTQFNFSFDWTSLALQLALDFLMDILTCNDMTEQEQMLALKRGSNLCHHPPGFTYCSSKTLFGICLEHKQSWCCYNSKLAKAINTQGREQLSKSFGSAKYPDCSGFTSTELNSLNFAAMNLDDVYSEVLDNMPTDFTGTQSSNRDTVRDNVLCKTESGGYSSSFNYNCNKNSGGRVHTDGVTHPD